MNSLTNKTLKIKLFTREGYWMMRSMKIENGHAFNNDLEYEFGLIEHYKVRKAIKQHFENKEKKKEEDLLDHFLTRVSGMDSL